MTINNLRNNAGRYKRKYNTEATKRIGTIIKRHEHQLRWLKESPTISDSISTIFRKLDMTSLRLYSNAINPNAGTIEYPSETIRDCLRDLSQAKSYQIDLLQVKKEIIDNAELDIKNKYREFKIGLIAETNRLFEERKSNIEFQSSMSNEMIKHNISAWVPNGNLERGIMFSMPMEFSFEKYINQEIYDEGYDGESNYIPQKLPDKLKFKANVHLGVMTDMRGQYTGFKLFDDRLQNFKTFHSSNQGNVCIGDLVIDTNSIRDIIRNGEWSKLKNMFEQIRIMFKTIHKENGFHENFYDHDKHGNELIAIDNFIENGCVMEE